MQTFRDILDVLKMYDVYIHLGKRLWDIELAAIEVDNLAKAQVIDQSLYLKMKLVLEREHRQELEHPLAETYK
ncbi:YqgQ family protein [Weissella kandleri]|nr:YqgQ family protein [Weissella kandleri]